MKQYFKRAKIKGWVTLRGIIKRMMANLAQTAKARR